CVCVGLCEYLPCCLNLGARLCMFYCAVLAYIVFLWRLMSVIIIMQARERERERCGVCEREQERVCVCVCVCVCEGETKGVCVRLSLTHHSVWVYLMCAYRPLSACVCSELCV